MGREGEGFQGEVDGSSLQEVGQSAAVQAGNLEQKTRGLPRDEESGLSRIPRSWTSTIGGGGHGVPGLQPWLMEVQEK